MDNKELERLLTLNEEQKRLLEEWKDLAGRMHKADMLFIVDEFDGKICVLNSEFVEELNEQYDLSRDIEEYEEVDEFALGDNYNLFHLPNRTTYNSDFDKLYVKFKQHSAD